MGFGVSAGHVKYRDRGSNFSVTVNVQLLIRPLVVLRVGGVDKRTKSHPQLFDET